MRATTGMPRLPLWPPLEFNSAGNPVGDYSLCSMNVCCKPSSDRVECKLSRAQVISIGVMSVEKMFSTGHRRLLYTAQTSNTPIDGSRWRTQRSRDPGARETGRKPLSDHDITALHRLPDVFSG